MLFSMQTVIIWDGYGQYCYGHSKNVISDASYSYYFGFNRIHSSNRASSEETVGS